MVEWGGRDGGVGGTEALGLRRLSMHLNWDTH